MMKYLILNKKIENGTEIKIEEYSKNLVEKLSPKDLIYAELVYEDEVREKASFYGDISIDLVASPCLELHISKYVYEVECKDDKVVVVKTISDDRYLNLLFDLLDSKLNLAYKDEWLVLDALSVLNIDNIDIDNLLNRVKYIFDKQKYLEKGFVKLIKIFNERISDNDKREIVTSFMYEYLDKNIDRVVPLLLDRDEERYVLENIDKEKYPTLHYILDKSLNDEVDEEDYLPF